MLGLLKKIFGSKHEKDVKEILPVVEEINAEYAKLRSLSDEDLRAKTIEFRKTIQSECAEIEAEIQQLKEELKTRDLSRADYEEKNNRVKELDTELFEKTQEVLDDLLVPAFAVVKEVCRRLTERKHQYQVVGNDALWEMIPYDVQLIGGIVIHQGKISEMATGEGKTLVAVAPMYLNALTGRGVHLVTVNDYLARRDCEWMKPVFDFLGIETGYIESQQIPQTRLDLYNCDITYGTNNEFGFDYLRDNMVIDAEDMVQRGHFFAIVDEVDSVLIDEARTPLIISGPVGHASDQKYESMVPRVRRLVDAQQRLINTLAAEAEKYLKSDKKEDRKAAGIALLRSNRGFPKHKRLQKLLQEPDNQKLLRETELDYLRDQGTRMSEIDDELYYTIDEKNHQIDIMEKGRVLLAAGGEDPDMFVIPDLPAILSALEGNTTISAEEKQLQKDEAIRHFSERSDVIHTLTQLLRAYSLYERDVEYVVDNGKVKIVDEFTGRILEGRRYSDGLHQAIEAKENVHVEQDTQTLATITLQNYFRLYKKLAGMTGTAETEAGEFEKIYKLEVVVIPTNRPIVRKDQDDLIYKTKREKFNAVVEEVQKLRAEGRAILVGTTSVEVSELLSKMLKRLNIPHNVLNAKHHQREAEIIMQAGQKGAVTIATNMAGRGTDIKLAPEVKAAGGLAIIGTERHEARRIDRQLRGRAGRQGDPGSSLFFISLEDNLMRLFGGERIAGWMSKMNYQDGEPIQAPMVTRSVEGAQKKVEENNFGIRKRLIDYDDVMNQQRTAIYDMRRQVIFGDRMKNEIFGFVENVAYNWYDTYHAENNPEALKNMVRATLLSEPEISDSEFKGMSADDCVERIISAAKEFYDRKEAQLGDRFMAQIERYSILQMIDEKWRDHLVAMDDLKEGIHLRAYGQKDPLLEYKGEALNLFQELVGVIQKESVAMAFKYYPQVTRVDVRPVKPMPERRRAPMPVIQHDEGGKPILPVGATMPAPVVRLPQETRDVQMRVGRNSLCPCGSGKKFKQCHGKI